MKAISVKAIIETGKLIEKFIKDNHLSEESGFCIEDNMDEGDIFLWHSEKLKDILDQELLYTIDFSGKEAEMYVELVDFSTEDARQYGGDSRRVTTEEALKLRGIEP